MRSSVESHMALATGMALKGNTPFGAVIVREGSVLSAVHNTVW